ncbi:MAG TPA: carbon monoxide dehydrogenase, partial [bacterium]|nr:carbon monoxide dehydrogenase [bacterium]HEX67446.1 carbon monoxide dehydrogenase [bacterium]
MKIAVSGKGGVGKTTIVAVLGEVFRRKGKRVILIDADPDANLARTLGIKENITPLIELKSIIQERTGAEPGKPTVFFTLNPKVDDIPEKFFYRKDNLMLGVMGTVRGGGMGCTCPENAFLKALLQHLIFYRNDVLLMDMEAGVEHLGRGTAMGVDWMIVVVEPGAKSIDTARKILKLARDLRIKNMGILGNKIKDNKEEEILKKSLSPCLWLGAFPYREGFL